MSRPVLLCPLLVLVGCCAVFTTGATTATGETYLGQQTPGTTPELFHPGTISTGHHEICLTIAPSGGELILSRSDQTFFSVLLRYGVGDDGLTEPSLPPFAGRYRDAFPSYSPDGSRLFFNSNRPLEPGGAPIDGNHFWVVERQGDGWSAPTHLGPQVNAVQHQATPSVASDGTLYFHAWSEEGLGASDLFHSELVDGSYGPPRNLGPSINASGREFHPHIAPDESFLLFDASDREDGFGSNDLYLARRLDDGSWAPAVNLGATVNTPFSEMRPRLSPDGRFLFFTSDRFRRRAELPVGQTIVRIEAMLDGPTNGSQDIYWVDAGFLAEIRGE
ncbi:MAG: hypothetical protein ABIF77_09915 [bacterium]